MLRLLRRRAYPLATDTAAPAPTLRQRAGSWLETGYDIACVLGSAGGAAALALRGKAVLALVLVLVALGFALRLARRRPQGRAATGATPVWAGLAAGLLALVEVAVLTEAADLPVRFHQEGFAPQHWLWVLAAWLVAFGVQLRLLRRLAAGRRRPV